MKTKRNAAKTKSTGVKQQAVAMAAALEPAVVVGAESTAVAAVLEEDDDAARPPRDLILGSKCPRLRAWLAARGDSTAEASTKAGLA